MIDKSLPEFPAAAFARQDNGDDLTFYAPPRAPDFGAPTAVVAPIMKLVHQHV